MEIAKQNYFLLYLFSDISISMRDLMLKFNNFKRSFFEEAEIIIVLVIQ